MTLKILTIGKKHEFWVADGIERYQKRLKGGFAVEWVLLPHSSLQGHTARTEESQRILARLKDTDYVVLLDERGENMDSPTLAARIDAALARSASIVFIIGGAYGVDDSVTRRAQMVWSLSLLVFPHQLVRLIVTEQLYRAQQIVTGGSYHHE